MVVYDLICSQGHSFEGWFDNLSDLENQLTGGVLACPVCGNSEISRSPSTFGLIKSTKRELAQPPSPQTQNQQTVIQEMYNKLKDLSVHLEKEYVDVGPNFADEALKMHYGVTTRRNIRGLSTDAQEDMLRKEGIDFFKIPMLSRKNTDSTND